mmetsp:Transcript_43021/g.113115  ORF Transcript_43021/g.113115 Transcript_43021/m.113115 type:complete len:131 (-) Transcript_43021:457-849(-)
MGSACSARSTAVQRASVQATTPRGANLPACETPTDRAASEAAVVAAAVPEWREWLHKCKTVEGGETDSTYMVVRDSHHPLGGRLVPVLDKAEDSPLMRRRTLSRSGVSVESGIATMPASPRSGVLDTSSK